MHFPKTLNRLLITWFGCGLMPLAPGTAGSLGALPLCWLLSSQGQSHNMLMLKIAFACAMTGLAIFTAGQDQLTTTTKDPQYVVIDEVAGMLWTTLLVPATWQALSAGFVLFRIFDVLKPFPANLFDRRSKSAKTPFERGACIVLDDVMAGFYGLALLSAIPLLAKYFFDSDFFSFLAG